jgi:hypothetical protein
MRSRVLQQQQQQQHLIRYMAFGNSNVAYQSSVVAEATNVRSVKAVSMVSITGRRPSINQAAVFCFMFIEARRSEVNRSQYGQSIRSVTNMEPSVVDNGNITKANWSTADKEHRREVTFNYQCNASHFT